MYLHESDLNASYIEEQLPYHAIKNEYSGTLILVEALLFMDQAFPEWKTNKGVGKWAAEFMYDSLESLAYLDDEDTEYSSFEILKNLYEVLVDNYQRKKGSYSYAIIDSIKRDFDIANEDFEYDNEHLSVEDYIALYNMKLAEFEIEYLKIVTYNFDFL
tara:strand:- start:10008 stop:10484 length:477 start_codon:yes stop_codon:yes gene_type:complete